MSPNSSRIFVWKNFSAWKPTLVAMFPETLTPEFEAKVRENAALVEYCDDPGAFEELSGHSIDSIVTKEKTDEFRRRYSDIRVYHACRTEGITSYREKGILLLSKDEQIERFRSIFLSGRFPELTEEMLQQSIKEVDSCKKDAEDELCLALDERFIIEYCGHYLIYGCEYLSNLVSQLHMNVGDTEPYRSVLRKIGKPTLLEINLPNTLEYVGNGIIYVITREMLTAWTYCLAHSRTHPHYLDCTVSVFSPLSPDHICGCDHPQKIPDQFMGRRIYNAETGEYGDPD